MNLESLESLHGELTDVSWRRLQTHLESVKVGRNIDFTTPFLPKEWINDQFGYGEWMFNNFAITDIELLNEIEEHESKKFGPTSLRAPWEQRRDGVLDYFDQIDAHDGDDLRYAFNKVLQLLSPNSLLPLDLDLAFKRSPKGKNLGLPQLTSDRRYEGDYLRRIKSIAAGGWKEPVFPAVVGWRGQPNGSTTLIKNRVVWMEDHAESYGSTGVVQVLIEKLRNKPGFAAWNELSYVDRRITSMIDRAKAPILSVDFSGFDKTLPEVLIHYAFDLIRAWFTAKSKQQIDWIERQFLGVGLVTPDGIYTERHGGVPSGSGCTNIIDSLCQMLAAYAADYTLNLGLRDIEVLGDDGVYTFDREINVDAVSDYYLNRFGMVVSADKGGYEIGSVQFLQRLHYSRYRVHGICVGMRSLIRTWNGICHLERLHKGLRPEFFSARAVMSLENSKWHPRFRELVKYLYQHDTYLRDFDVEEVFKRAGGVGFVENVLGLRSYRYTSELPTSGLSQFSTVKELRRLRGGTGRSKRVA